MTSFTNAIKEGKVDIVPKTLVNSGATENGGGNAFESLIMLLLSEKLTVSAGESMGEDDMDIKRIRDEILAQLSVKEPEAKEEVI